MRGTNITGNLYDIIGKLSAQKESGHYIVIKGIKETAKMPLSVCRGSEAQRFKMAQRCSDKMQKSLERISNGNECQVSDFEEALNGVLEDNKIAFSVKKNTDKASGGIIEYYPKNGFYYKEGSNICFLDYSVSDYTIYLPIDEERGVITDKHIALHEVRHLFDHIHNPKQLVVRKAGAVFAPEEQRNAFIAIGDNFTQMGFQRFNSKLFKKSVSEKLDILDDDMAINVLQSSRNLLKTEINAYKDTIKYLAKKPISNLSKLKILFKAIYKTRQKKKLQIANELLRERLQIARENFQKERELAAEQKKD